jgi:hypothetical protein
MATAAEMSAAYLKQLTAHGETFSISNGTETTTVLGRFLRTSDSDLTDSIESTTVKAVILAAVAFPPEEGFTVTAGGRSFVIRCVDDLTRRIAGALIAYELTLVN